MTMLYPQEDGKLVEIPDEHAAVLALYRDRMPVVFEVQECGPPMLYPLIDVDEEPYGTPRPGALEYAARRVAAGLKARRLGEDPAAPDFERLALAAIRAYVQDMADFAAAVAAYGDGPAAEHQAAKTEAARAGRKLTKAVERAVRDAQAAEEVAA
ncbi:hypothetical protein [Streptomyces sp. ME19-01-6]|uniref:hypothetical protein n=1 Tax=Streptomyces sp. ME19-01-6 TaxID=3028686 RepID=UPI0029BE2132|nr:hypothetical protein [Streptomyces sp. ME19-01-6]MDX3229392.1 hypothetical protein [Streptomyces sp. ME19-01-6]